MSNAIEYADSLIQDITARSDAGSPFGWINDDGEWFDLDEHTEDMQEASALDYLSDALDIQYLVNSDKTYRSGRVCIAFGGPTAWVDTHTQELEVSWWSASEVRRLPSDFINGLDEALEELYGC